MKKIILTCLIILSSLVSNAQQQHTYRFKIQGCSTPAEAKEMIAQFRSILNIKVFYFDDATDTFKTSNDREYNWNEIAEDLAQFNIFLEGEVEHVQNF